MSEPTKRPLLRRPRFLIAIVLAILFVWARWGPMRPLFEVPYSTELLDRNGELLGALVAADGQWRMPMGDSIPQRFERCLLQFEDRSFRRHPGIHLPALVRAWMQNRKAGRRVSGGSTLTMQVARLAGGNRERTIANKVGEMLLALRIELRHSKDEILAMHAAHAPFGGNVVGLEAAAWRWFGKAPEELGWAECATLAVLPNSPATIHPGRNRDALKAKRDRLLGRLLHTGDLDSLQWSLALEEPLPEAPLPLPRRAPQLLGTLHATGYGGKRITTTLDGDLQDRASAMADRHANTLRANEVHNAAVLIMDNATGEVLAYVGNLPSATAEHAGSVDIVRAERSTGSLLKPFLYAAMLQHGERMPDQLVADLPTSYEGFAPRNYDKRHLGAVSASEALSRSLNIPAVRGLREHGVDRALRMLQAMGLKSLNRPGSHYGLSLVVGGAESTLWQLVGAYASLARIAAPTINIQGPAVIAPHVVHHEHEKPQAERTPPLSKAAVYHTLQALQKAERPLAEAGWKHFANARQVAWKTGTSFGHRDAWAIGVTSAHTVGVWTGNASGEGRPGLTGTLAAAPLLFELFTTLPPGEQWDRPYDDMDRMAVCRSSGFRASPTCEPVDSLWILRAAGRSPLCTYHCTIRVNADATLRVRPGPGSELVSWFVLPPAMEHYYAPLHPNYRPLPPWEAGAGGEEGNELMELIYPEAGARIHVPVLLDGTYGQVVLQAAHRDHPSKIHWDLDGRHLGSTADEHRIPVDLSEGTHRLTLTDQGGRSIAITFQVDRGKRPKR